MPLSAPAGLSRNQAAIWLDQQLFAGKPIYVTGQFLEIPGALRFDVFERALRETILECPGLRLHAQSVSVPFPLPVLDFRGKTEPRAVAIDWMRGEMRVPISLSDASLFRFALIRVSEDATIWFQKFHHIIIDATGRRLLSERTARRYRALRFGEPLPRLDALTHEQLLDEEAEYTHSDAYEDDRRFWLEQAASWPAPLLDVERRRSDRAQSGLVQRTGFTLKRVDFERLAAASEAMRVTPFRAIIALNYVAFARLYDRHDILLGVELANRSKPGARQAVGLFAWPAPMHIRIERTTTIAAAIQQIDAISSRNYPHRRFPVQDLARELQLARKGHYSLFDVMINYIPSPYEFAFEEGQVELKNLAYGFTAPWTVSIVDTGKSRDLEVTVDSDAGLVPAGLGHQLASSLAMLFERGLDRPDCQIGALATLSGETQQQLLALSAGDRTSAAENDTVASLCAAQAARSPHVVAVKAGAEWVTYSELHERACRLARRLAKLGVRPGVVVGVGLPRNPELIVAVLAVHKAGAAYLALDPAYPGERIRFMVADSSVPVIITNADLADMFAGTGARLLLDGDDADDTDATIELEPARPDDLAYVLYTSGSTGLPKAAGIEHRNVLNLIIWARSIITDRELSGMLFSTSLNFDLSVFEIFVPLVWGGTIVLVDNLLALTSRESHGDVRLINTGPTLLEALLRTTSLPGDVTTIIVAGEKLSRRMADTIFEAAPKARLLNCYGPTETTVYSSCSRIDPNDRDEPSIGRPILNTTLHVLDSGNALVPPGVHGELFIGGAGVGRGYIGRPELTAARFMPDPFGPGRLYRTGDRVRWRENGELEYSGRIDYQIKIHGVRVEPGEIEAAILSLPGVSSAVVALREDSTGAARLTAYLVRASSAAPAADEIRATLERRLPQTMVPVHYVFMDVLPLTPNGKVDRDALPRPRAEYPRSGGDVAPESELERRLATMWEEILEIPHVGVHADFFELGGDSLALLSLFAGIEATFGRILSADVLADGLTIARLARLLSQEAKTVAPSAIIPLQPIGTLPPFFCVPGLGGDPIHLRLLAVKMGCRRPFLALGRDPDVTLAATVEEMAAFLVSAMLQHQPAGPYYLGGISFGAVIAYEIARQLEQAGHQVGYVASLDQRRPDWRFSMVKAIPVLPRMLASDRVRSRLRGAVSAGNARQVRQLVLRWFKAAIGYRESAMSMLDLHGFEADVIDRCEADLRAFRAYRPGRLQASFALFRAEEQPLAHMALDRTLGWSDIVDGEVRVRVVPGNHHTIRTEPFVNDLANALMRDLDAAQGGTIARMPERCGAALPAKACSPGG